MKTSGLQNEKLRDTKTGPIFIDHFRNFQISARAISLVKILFQNDIIRGETIFYKLLGISGVYVASAFCLFVLEFLLVFEERHEQLYNPLRYF